MKDYIDKMISKNLNEKDNVPKSISHRIIKTVYNDCFKEEKRKEKKCNTIYKFATGLCACLVVTTGVVFAKEIATSIFGLSKFSYGEQKLQSAIENNYIQSNESEQYISSKEGILYKFNNVLLNDINLIISLDFIFKDDIENYQGLSISGLAIKDENNNQIFIYSEDQNIYFNNIATSMSHHTTEKEKRNIKESLVFISPQFGKFKKLYLSFDSIILYNVINGNTEIKEIEGNYNIEIPISSTFDERNSTYYNIQEISKIPPYIEIREIKLTNTGLGILFDTKEFEGIGYKIKIYDKNDNEVYSKINEVSNYKSHDTYFIWVDVDKNFEENDYYKLELIDINQQSYLLEITK